MLVYYLLASYHMALVLKMLTAFFFNNQDMTSCTCITGQVLPTYHNSSCCLKMPFSIGNSMNNLNAKKQHEQPQRKISDLQCLFSNFKNM